MLTSTRQMVVRSLPPVVDLGSDVIAQEGDELTFIGNITFVTDGPRSTTKLLTVTDSAGKIVASSDAESLTFAPLDEGDYHVELVVTSEGTFASDSITLTVENVGVGLSLNTTPNLAALVLPGQGPQIRDVVLGEEYVLTGSFTDAGADLWTGTADFGDGIVRPLIIDGSTKTFSARHTYTRGGSYLVTVSLGDQDGEAATATIGVVVGVPRVAGVFVRSTDWAADFLDSLAQQSLVDPELGLAIPAGPNQLQPLVWDNLNQVSFRFTQDVDIDTGDLLIRTRLANLPVESVDYDSHTWTATYKLGQPLKGGLLVLELLDDVTATATGISLDGQWTAGRGKYPTGDGAPGGDLLFSLLATPGDYDADRSITDADRALLVAAIEGSTYDVRFDLNGDGLLNAADLDHLELLLASIPLPGDYDGNGRVDQPDYNLWKSQFGDVGVGLAADGNNDGRVDLADYTVWQENLGSSSSPDSDVLGDYGGNGVVDQPDYEPMEVAVWRCWCRPCNRWEQRWPY